MKDCFFCKIQNPNNKEHKHLNKIIENESFIARWDGFPVSEGHVDVVIKRHIESIFDLKDSEAKNLLGIIKEVKKILDKRYSPQGYTVGVNEGRAAGRTIDHLHVQFIPRYEGDVPDPTGGVRNVIPGKGNYLR